MKSRKKTAKIGKSSKRKDNSKNFQKEMEDYIKKFQEDVKKVRKKIYKR